VIAFNNSSSRRDCGFGMARNSYKIGIRGKKNTGESSNTDKRLREQRSPRSCHRSRPGMSVEKLGRNSVKTEMGKGEKKEKGSNSRATEFSRDSSSGIRWRRGRCRIDRRAWIATCYIRDWQLSTGAETDVRSTDRSSLIRALTLHASSWSLTNRDCTCEIIDPRVASQL